MPPFHSSTPMRNKSSYSAFEESLRRSPRKHAQDLPIPPPSSQLFFDVHDVMFLVAGQCSWKDLVALIHTNRVLRRVVFHFIRTRIKIFISPFIPNDKIGIFFNLMDDCNAAVFGGIVRCIMSTTCSVYRLVAPNTMDLVVPSTVNGISKFRRWMRLLIALGYKEVVSCDASEDLPSCVRWTILSNDGRMTISLIESKGPSILPVILQAPHTSSFNILTSTRFYCLYPALFANSEGIRMKHFLSDNTPFSHFNFGLRVYRTASIWDEAPCGNACPSLWRSTKNLSGVGTVRWGTINGSLDLGDKSPSKSDGFENVNVLWKIDGRCINSLCPNRGREVDLFGHRGYY